MAIGLAVIASRARLAESASIALMAKHAGVQASLLRSIGAKAAGMAFRDGGILVLMAAAAGVGVLVTGARKLPAVLPAVLLLGLVTWDLCIVNGRFVHPTPMEPLASYYPETPAIRFLKSQPAPFRILPLGEEFSSNAYMYHGLESIGGYHPAKLAVYDDLLDKVGMTNLKLLAMLNVKYVIGPEQLDHPAFRKVAPGVHEFLGALPRAFLVGRTEQAPSENAALNMFGIDSFDPATSAAIVENLPGPVESPEGGSVEIVSWQAERLEVRASVPRPCLLVFSEIYYAPGWKAFVDGAETRIYRTDYAFRSVYLEPGTHTVVMSYAGDAVRLGLVLSLCAAAAIALLWALPARARRRTP
jgi:hypothetical protein